MTNQDLHDPSAPSATAMRPRTSTNCLLALVLLGLGAASCGDGDPNVEPDDGAPNAVARFAKLVPLPAGSTEALAHVLSSDGRFVAGTSTGTTAAAFRWDSRRDELLVLPPLSGCAAPMVVAITDDGKTIIGNCETGFAPFISFIWKDDGTATGSIQEFQHTEFEQILLTGMSDDGKVIVGCGNASTLKPCTLQSFDAATLTFAFYWTAAKGVTPLVPNASMTDVSADGVVFIGDAVYGQDGATLLTTGFRATLAGGLYELGYLYDTQPTSSVTAVSRHGEVIGGTSYAAVQGPSGSLPVPVRWTAGTGFVSISPLSDAEGNVSAVSADGSILVGPSLSVHSNARPYVWTETSGHLLLNQLLTSADLLEGLEGAAPVTVEDVSADGTVFLGVAANNATGVVQGYITSVPIPAP